MRSDRIRVRTQRRAIFVHRFVEFAFFRQRETEIHAGFSKVGFLPQSSFVLAHGSGSFALAGERKTKAIARLDRAGLQRERLLEASERFAALAKTIEHIAEAVPRCSRVRQQFGDCSPFPLRATCIADVLQQFGKILMQHPILWRFGDRVAISLNPPLIILGIQLRCEFVAQLTKALHPLGVAQLVCEGRQFQAFYHFVDDLILVPFGVRKRLGAVLPREPILRHRWKVWQRAQRFFGQHACDQIIAFEREVDVLVEVLRLGPDGRIDKADP